MESVSVRKGAWTPEEDLSLRKCIEKFGEGNWCQVPSKAGLKRCRKSCRMRWLNYLSPKIKRGQFGDDEIDLIIRLHKLLGNRWSLIAGRIPGRTANDIKNFWNSHLSKKLVTERKETVTGKTEVIKPQPRRLSMNRRRDREGQTSGFEGPQEKSTDSQTPLGIEDDNLWLEGLLTDVEEEQHTGEMFVPSGIESEDIDWNGLIWELGNFA